MLSNNFKTDFDSIKNKECIKAENEEWLIKVKPSKKLKQENSLFLNSIFCFSHFFFRYSLFISVFLFSNICIKAQDSIVIKGQFIGNSKYAKVIMKKFGIGSFIVGGASIQNEKFSMTLPPDIEAGVYRFQYAMVEGEQYFDLIINGKEKEIQFTLEANNPQALPHFLDSNENKQWYEYIIQNQNQLERISLLNQFINVYPNRTNDLIKIVEKEWEIEKELYWKSLNNYRERMKGTWANEMVSNRPYYFTNPNEDPRIQDFQKREHFWDGFNANNPKLINTPLYTEHILNYLRYWLNPNMNFSSEEKTAGFKKAVDVIIRKFSGNKETYNFAYKYLVLGFKEIGEEEVLQYLDENYKEIAEQCYDEFEITEFEKRMIGYAAMKVGNKAPDFKLNVIDGNTAIKNLYKLNSNKTLIVFWSSSCPHCLEEMPKLNTWAANQKEIKVIAVSMDTDKEVFQSNAQNFPNMIHTCDYNGWNSEPALKYYIAATPSFIMLDNEKKIIGKYSTSEKLRSIKLD